MQNSNTVFNSVFSKQHKVFLESFGIQSPNAIKLGQNKAIALTLQVNLEPLGFTLSKEALIQLSHLSENELVQVWESLFSQAQKATGSHREVKKEDLLPIMLEDNGHGSEIIVEKCITYMKDYKD